MDVAGSMPHATGIWGGERLGSNIDSRHLSRSAADPRHRAGRRPVEMAPRLPVSRLVEVVHEVRGLEHAAPAQGIRCCHPELTTAWNGRRWHGVSTHKCQQSMFDPIALPLIFSMIIGTAIADAGPIFPSASAAGIPSVAIGSQRSTSSNTGTASSAAGPIAPKAQSVYPRVILSGSLRRDRSSGTAGLARAPSTRNPFTASRASPCCFGKCA